MIYATVQSVLTIILPGVILLGCVPGIYVIWFSLWCLSLFVGQKAYFAMEEKVWSVYQRVCLFLLETCNTNQVIYHGDYDCLKGKLENVLYISNHQSDMDWVLCDAVIAQQGRIGRLRYVLKDVLKYVPIYGHYFYEHGCIYVDRGNFQENKARQSLQFLKNAQLPCWLIIFPEGTRINPEHTTSISKSQEFAKKHGLAPLRHHLTPRVRGVELILHHLRDYLDAVYDVTCFYEDAVLVQEGDRRVSAPTLFNWFQKKRTIHIHIQRIPMDDVPMWENTEASLRWLHSRFLIKDKIFDELISGLHVDTERSNVNSDDVVGSVPGTPPHNYQWPRRNGKLSWLDTFPAMLGLLLWNCLLFWVPSWGLYFYVATWLWGTLWGWAVVVCKV